MGRRAWGSAVMIAIALIAGHVDATQGQSRREIALELARLAVDDAARKRVGEGVTGSLVRAVSSSLQERLNRRLVDVEWKLLDEIVGRFVRDTLPEQRIEELAAEVYIRHFDEAELRAMLDFQRSAVGRKFARLTPTIGIDTTRAIDAEIRESPAMRDMLSELRRAFPVLGGVESP